MKYALHEADVVGVLLSYVYMLNLNCCLQVVNLHEYQDMSVIPDTALLNLHNLEGMLNIYFIDRDN